ncbi:PD-(D/E)XK nuclease family protein [Massilia sp. W12]|uniref:PD-(D/E)XK nuclease family protein n=1 Tax=Massilia sp. W12 TaxID=3126507 RepID=UPI0030D1E19A
MVAEAKSGDKTPRTLWITAGAQFWPQALAHLQALGDLAQMQIIVPAYSHAQAFKQELARQAGPACLRLPRINTLDGWLSLQGRPEAAQGGVQRMLQLYAGLRKHAWLAQLFAAHHNTDLLPLAQLLLTLSDELTTAHLPRIEKSRAQAGLCWEQALAQLPPSSRELLSQEAQLVWAIWQSQLDEEDALVQRHRRLQAAARRARQTLVWISPEAPSAIEQAFLDAWARHARVLLLLSDWRAASVPPLLAQAWPEMLEHSARPDLFADAPPPPNDDVLQHVRLYPAHSLEAEAQAGAQAIFDWLQAGLQKIAIIAQERVAARRIAALLARAGIQVADETGWKLSTTRAAAALMAWLDLVAGQCDSLTLLELLKSPFVRLREDENRSQAEIIWQIEQALRRANVTRGWDMALQALKDAPLPPAARDAPLLLRLLHKQAARHAGRHSMREWAQILRQALRTLGMPGAFARDFAGRQILQVLEQCELQTGDDALSFTEWRAMLALQLESLPCAPDSADTRVAMLPFNGARLRQFEAVLVVGCDADNLPSRAPETLFFANAVRRELLLATRESRQRQQLRDFCEILLGNRSVMLSWQAHKDGQPNQASPWLLRLQLCLAQQGRALELWQEAWPQRSLLPARIDMPRPAAAPLLPARLSASACNSLFACPYQFFARHMLRISALDEWEDMPLKRDFGDWMHEILYRYHESLRQQPIADVAQRAALLAQIGEEKFAQERSRNGVALVWLARWRQIMPRYLEWQESADSSYASGEMRLEAALPWPGGSVQLYGRIDRIDHVQDEAGNRGALLLLDYKTGNQSTLKKKLTQREDQQLPFYGLLARAHQDSLGGALEKAAYLVLHKEEVKTVQLDKDDFAGHCAALEQRLLHSMQAIQQGAPLPAHGSGSVCEWCEMRGLCRKGAW